VALERRVLEGADISRADLPTCDVRKRRQRRARPSTGGRQAPEAVDTTNLGRTRQGESLRARSLPRPTSNRGHSSALRAAKRTVRRRWLDSRGTPFEDVGAEGAKAGVDPDVGEGIQSKGGGALVVYFLKCMLPLRMSSSRQSPRTASSASSSPGGDKAESTAAGRRRGRVSIEGDTERRAAWRWSPVPRSFLELVRGRISDA